MQHHELLLKMSCIADNICSCIRNFLRPSNGNSNAFIYIEDKLTPKSNLAFGAGFFRNYRPYLQGSVSCGDLSKPTFANRWIVTEAEAENFFDYAEIILKKCVEGYSSELPLALSRLKQYTDLLSKVVKINNAIVYDSDNVDSLIHQTIDYISNTYIVKDTDGKSSQLLLIATELNSVLKEYLEIVAKVTNRDVKLNSKDVLAVGDIVSFSVEASDYLSKVTVNQEYLTAFIDKNSAFNVFNPKYGNDSLAFIKMEFDDIRSYFKFGYSLKPFFDAKVSAIYNQLTDADKPHFEIFKENVSGLRSIVILNELNAIYLRNYLSGKQDHATAMEMYSNSISSYYRLSDTQEYLSSTLLNDKVNALLKLMVVDQPLVA